LLVYFSAFFSVPFFLSKKLNQNTFRIFRHTIQRTMSSPRFNELFIQVLGQMAQQTGAKGEHFKARAYKKAQETIMKFGGNISKLEDIEGQPGIGKSILDTLGKATLSGSGIHQSEFKKVTEDPLIVLTGVYGIGPKKAAELVESGITTIAQLRKVQHEVLNDKQIIGLKYYEDVLKRIPRAEIDEYNKVLGKTMLKTLDVYGFNKNDAKYEIVGSYRRGAQDSGDIDMIVTSETPQIFILWIDRLIKYNVILEVLSRGPSKCLVMAQIPGTSVVRRVDFLYSPPDEFAFSILYFTGSKEFNTVMRGRALQYGLTLNEHGFHHMVQGDKGRKVKGPKLTKVFNDEKDIFDHLEMAWKEPEERKDGSCVIGLENL
jgi:DNA polymerase IV